jgi:hypothetical protein
MALVEDTSLPVDELHADKDSTMPDFWDVSTWVSVDSRRPLESKQFKRQDDAERYATQQRERIAARGWTHVVTVQAGMIQK